MLPFPILNQYGNDIKPNEYPKFLTDLGNGTIVSDVVADNNSIGSNNTRAYYNTQLHSTSAGVMYGSTYLQAVTNDSTIHRMMQHAFPTLELYTENVTNQRFVYFSRAAQGTYSYTSVTRNGYTSNAYPSYTGVIVDIFVYFDADTGYMMQYNPNVDNTPTRFYS